MTNEPAVTVGSFTAALSAVLALVATVLHLTADQTAALLGLVGPVLALAQALVTRAHVTPVRGPNSPAQAER